MLNVRSSPKTTYCPKSVQMFSHVAVHRTEIRKYRGSTKPLIREDSWSTVLWLFSNIAGYALVNLDHWPWRQKNIEQCKNTKRSRRYSQGENNQTAKEEKRVASVLNLLLTAHFLTYTRVDGHQHWLTTGTHISSSCPLLIEDRGNRLQNVAAVNSNFVSCSE